MAKSQKVDLNVAVADFAQQYEKPGSGITAVSKHGNSIRVDVDSVDAAERLPISYNGANVATFIKTGSRSVMLLLRDRNGRVLNRP